MEQIKAGKLTALGVSIDVLSEEQKAYLGV